jgi:hypothetical protein
MMLRLSRTLTRCLTLSSGRAPIRIPPEARRSIKTRLRSSHLSKHTLYLFLCICPVLLRPYLFAYKPVDFLPVEGDVIHFVKVLERRCPDYTCLPRKAVFRLWTLRNSVTFHCACLTSSTSKSSTEETFLKSMYDLRLASYVCFVFGDLHESMNN